MALRFDSTDECAMVRDDVNRNRRVLRHELAQKLKTLLGSDEGVKGPDDTTDKATTIEGAETAVNEERKTEVDETGAEVKPSLKEEYDTQSQRDVEEKKTEVECIAE
uniref:Uncharacterized protein n=1 Tax=Entomoneis paludosa TaxID=265537 RepID=A0A7S2YA85_9STRA|mmetsp:Transcript_2461/g.5082  ORF Transcript_2461/g.5082 Transcript_2461/m.5082 type:complete len:107 (+) Transcript_2461:87-407(+)